MEKRKNLERIVKRGKKRLDAIYRAKKGENERGELADRYRFHRPKR